MLQMFYLLQTYVVFKCFMCQRYVQRVIGGMARTLGDGAQRARGWRMGHAGVMRTRHARPHPGSRVLPARRERDEGGRGGERGAGRDERVRGTHAWRDEADWKGLQLYGRSTTRFCWAIRYRPMESYPIRCPDVVNSLLFLAGTSI